MNKIDELTGVLTRTAFLEKLDVFLAERTVGHQPAAVIMLDLDRFLQFNETYGRQAGDDWIKAVVLDFANSLGPEAIIGRVGGDEFIGVLPDEDPVAAFELAEAFRNRIETQGPALQIAGQPVQPAYTVSLGLAAFPGNGRDVSTLVEKARAALYRAKETGGNRVCFYEDKDPLTGLFNHYGILRKLEAALQAGREKRSDVSLLLVDIDAFGSINSEYGRRVGDEVLKRVGIILSRNFQDGVVGRYMADSFLVIMPEQRADSTFILAEEVRRLVEQTEIDLSIGRSSQAVHFKISGGVAAFPGDGVERIDLIRKAEEALYRAKQTGRNRICLPTSSQMVTKTSYYTQTQLERLAATAKKQDKSEAFLLREALDDLLRKYSDKQV